MTEEHTQLVKLTRESTVSVGVLRALIYAAEQVGVSRSQLLQAAGLDPEQLEHPDARLGRAEIYRVCEVVLTLSADPAFGLHWGERHDGYTFDLTAHLIAHSATLRAGLESLSEFHRLLTDQPSFQVVERDRHVFIHCVTVPGEALPLQRFMAEMSVIGFWRIVRAFGVDARPERASFEYGAPSYRAEYARVFEGAERFDQPFTGIVFDRALMNAASPHYDAHMQSVLRSIAEQRVLSLTAHTPYAVRVREYLVKQGTCCRLDMEAVAHSLGLSGRSLRRRLAEEGETYEQVAQAALSIVAKHVLATTRLTIEEAADALGFSYASTFHRAFKRWTGMTPLSYRAQQLRERYRTG